MYRTGIVTAVDPDTARARVRFPAHNNMESFWLAVGQVKTLKDKSYWLPDIGEQVACLLDDHAEDGVILCALYSAADIPPTKDVDLRVVHHTDGTVESFDRKNSLWALTLPQGRVQITVGSTVLTLTADGATVDADHLSLHGRKSYAWDVGGYGQRITAQGGGAYEIHTWQDGASISTKTEGIKPPDGR